MSFLKFMIIFSVAAAVGCGVVNSSTQTADIKDLAPASEVENPVGKDLKTAVFAGGCFWGVEAVFEHIKGVKDAKSGYSGGDAKTADYDKVSGGKTDHAEAVLVTYDPAQVSYTQLLSVFFSVAHDPTQLNRQGPDVGRHYRSAIFYVDEEQRRLASEYIAAIDKSKTFPKPVVTEIVPLVKFYDAEPYHQDYMAKNPNQPYIVMHDKPKLVDLKRKFPELYTGK